MGLKIRLFKVGIRVKKAFGRLFKNSVKKQKPKKITKKRALKEPLKQAVLPAFFESQVPQVNPIRASQEFSGVQLSPHTARAYTNDLKDFFGFLKTKGLFEDWNSRVGPIEIAEYRNFLIEKGLAKGSTTRKIAVLKSFYKWALAQNWVLRNPAELIRSFPQTQDSKTGFLSDPEIDTLLLRLNWATDRLSNHLCKVVVETLLMLGLRRSEAARIRLGALEYQEGKFLVTIEGKGDRTRRLPVPELLLETWASWLKRILPDICPETLAGPSENPEVWMDFFSRHLAQPLLVSSRGKSFDTPISPGEIARIVRKSARKAGLIQRVSPHMLRATAITHALDQGATHRGVQQMAGWTSPLMISRYDKRRKDPRFSAVLNLKYAQKAPPEESSDKLGTV